MKHTQILLGIAVGILLTVGITCLFDCGGKSTIIQKEIDSSEYRAAFQEGRQEGFLAGIAEKDSQLVAAKIAAKPARERYDKARTELTLTRIDTSAIDSLNLIRALVEDNYKCREVLLLADTVIKNLEIQLIVAFSRMNTDDSLAKSLFAERAELKNIIRLKNEQIEELSEDSWFARHKFELGFLAGAASVTAAVIAL